MVCFGAGVVGASRWLPELAEGPVGGLAFFATCGLLGAALGLLGLEIYRTVQGLETIGGRSPILGEEKSQILANGLVNMLFQAGSLFGLAAVVYLLAPRRAQAPDSVHQ